MLSGFPRIKFTYFAALALVLLMMSGQAARASNVLGKPLKVPFERQCEHHRTI